MKNKRRMRHRLLDELIAAVIASLIVTGPLIMAVILSCIVGYQ